MMKLKLYIAKIMDNKNTGGGYILPLSREKARMIKTPLSKHDKWNAMVNECETMAELEILEYSYSINQMTESDKWKSFISSMVKNAKK